MTTLVETAIYMYDCPTCGTARGKHCPTEQLCSRRLHLASLDREVIDAVVDSLMYSNPFAIRDAAINQQYTGETT